LPETSGASNAASRDYNSRRRARQPVESFGWASPLAAFLTAGRPADAEAIFRADLERNPANGWALFGLQQALTAQKKDAGAVNAELEKAWSRTDVKLAGAVF
jgi:predicted Zn-dependent protease